MTLSLLDLEGSENRLTSISHYSSINLAVKFFAFQAWLAIAIGLLLLFFKPWYAGLILITAGSVFLYSERRRLKRRLAVTSVFRPLANPHFSAWMLRSNWVWLDALKTLLTMGAAYLVSPFTDLLSWAFLWFLLLGVLMTPILFVGVASLVKFHLDADFRILVFRRNRALTNFAHKSIVMPACGMLGQVLLIYDDSLSSLKEGALARNRLWWLSEMYNPLVIRAGRNHWRQVVMIEMCFADFVVLDWSGEVTDNMLWELRHAAYNVPKERILVLISPNSDIPANYENMIVGRGIAYCPHPNDPISTALFKEKLIEMTAHLEVIDRGESSMTRVETIRKFTFLERIDWEAFEEGEPQNAPIETTAMDLRASA